MIDMMFDLGGGILPTAYPFALWEALVCHVPQLAEEKLVGVLPLRAAENNEGMLLPKRAKLVLRLPMALAAHAAALSGQQLDVAESTLQLGKGKLRPIQPYPTIHAQLVTGATDEVLFLDGINTQLNKMGIAARLICGKRRILTGAQQSIHGYSLVIHDLKPEASLQLQYAGLGEGRQFGCGIFVPYKVISGLG
jgi:CRISPR-associated protein Cas6